MATYCIAIAHFCLQNKHKRDWFFEKTFLLVDTNIEIVLSMSFFLLLETNIWFTQKKME